MRVAATDTLMEAPVADGVPVWRQILHEVEAAEHKRRQLLTTWSDSVDRLRGKPSQADSDTRRQRVTSTWALTRTKSAQLYSAAPEVRLRPRRPEVAAATADFAAALNQQLADSHVSTVIEEAVVDCLAASGIGAAIVAYEAITEPVDVPVVDPATLSPDQQLAILSGAVYLPTVSVQRPTDARFTIERISPQDLLIPVGFLGSDFTRAPWLGRTVRLPWARAKVEWRLSNAVKDQVVTQGPSTSVDQRLVDDVGEQDPMAVVEAREIFYVVAMYDPAARSFRAIHRLVLVKGLDTPSIDEPWQGQRRDEATGAYLGSWRLPIQVLTLTRIPDEPIPPADAAVTRPMELTLEDSLDTELKQRKHSVPIRWMDVNKIDAVIVDRLQQGEWQEIIPVAGSGEKAIGEVARAHYPAERTHFDARTRRDIEEAWSMGPNQTGSYTSGERSASEATFVQAGSQTRIAYERAKVARFFTGIAEVLAGLLQLYGDQPALREVPLSTAVLFDVRPDTLVIEEASARVQRLSVFLNTVGKSGFIDPEPVIREICGLVGLNPDEVMRRPEPAPPDALNISIRSREDLQDPLMVALLLKSGQGPGPDELAAAKRLLEAAYGAPVPQEVAPGGPIQEPDSLDGPPMPSPFGMLPQPDLAITGPRPVGPVDPQRIADLNPAWRPMPRVNRRRDVSGDLGEGA